VRLWIKTRARFPLLLHQLVETGQDKFAILFISFIGDRAKRSRNTPAVRLSVWVVSASALEFGLGFVAVGYARKSVTRV
jgi:hypothetical protein